MRNDPLHKKFAKLRVFPAHLPYGPTYFMCLLASCLKLLRAYLLTCLRVLIFHLSTYLRSFDRSVITCFFIFHWKNIKMPGFKRKKNFFLIVLYIQTLINVLLFGIFAQQNLYIKSKKYKNEHLDYHTTTSLVIILNS